MAKRLEIQFYNESTGESLNLPINPKDLGLPRAVNTNIKNIIGFGEVNRMRKPKLKTVNITNLLPVQNSFLNLLPTIFSDIILNIFSTDLSQTETIRMLSRWTYSADKIRVIVSDYFNELMQISDFAPIVEEGSENQNYNLNFIEYRDPTTDKGIITDDLLNGLKPRSLIRAIPNKTIAKQGEDFYSLADKYLNDGANFTEIMAKNNITDPNKAIEGLEIILK